MTIDIEIIASFLGVRSATVGGFHEVSIWKDDKLALSFQPLRMRLLLGVEAIRLLIKQGL